MNHQRTLKPSKLLRRDSALQTLLIGELRELLSEPMNEDTHPWLLAILRAMSATLCREICSREVGEYLGEVLEEYPSWERQVEELHVSCNVLYADLCRLHDRIALNHSHRVSATTRRDLSEWIDRLEQHDAQERQLIQTALNLEVGEGD